tara:strand:+ start:1433 stop:1609 length:177 start_codon:yes stop_codon:yes gene_type:complete
MDITSAQYYEDYTGTILGISFVCDGIEMSVPINSPDNRHYAEIMRQVAAGELTIADAD